MFGFRAAFVLLAVCAFSVDPEEHALRPRSPLFTISPETTIIDGPLTTYGTVDYVAHLNERYSEGVTVDSNAAVLLCEACGPGVFAEPIRDRYFELLGMQAPSHEGNYIIGLQDYVYSLDETDSQEAYDRMLARFDEARERAWTGDEFPELAEWIAINEAPLLIVTQASLRPRYYSPLVSTPDNYLARVQLTLEQSARHVSGLLAARAMLRLGAHDVEGAIDDILCNCRLGRLYAQGPMAIGRLVSIAVDHRSYQAAAAMLSSEELTEMQWARLAREYDELPPLADIKEVIEVSERFYTLNIVQEFLAGRLLLDLEPAPQTGLMARVRFVERVFRNIRMHPDQPLRIANDWYDDLTACAAADSWRAFKSEWDVMDARRTAFTKDYTVQMWYVGMGLWVREMGRGGGDFFVQQTTPHLGQIGEARYRVEARSRLLRIGLALARYRSAHGEYPDELAELSPDYLADVPLDPFTDEPMIYQLEANGYVLYSLSSNLIDDGGVDVSERQTDSDIVLRVNHSR